MRESERKVINLFDKQTHDLCATLSFETSVKHKEVKAFAEAFVAKNENCKYSELIEATCAKFDGEQLYMCKSIYV